MAAAPDGQELIDEPFSILHITKSCLITNSVTYPYVTLLAESLGSLQFQGVSLTLGRSALERMFIVGDILRFSWLEAHMTSQYHYRGLDLSALQGENGADLFLGVIEDIRNERLIPSILPSAGDLLPIPHDTLATCSHLAIPGSESDGSLPSAAWQPFQFASYFSSLPNGGECPILSECSSTHSLAERLLHWDPLLG